MLVLALAAWVLALCAVALTARAFVVFAIWHARMRAEALRVIADECAATVQVQNPRAQWDAKLVMTVQLLSDARGHQVSNVKAIERASAAALLRQGANREA